jgi:hypothetical protein
MLRELLSLLGFTRSGDSEDRAPTSTPSQPAPEPASQVSAASALESSSGSILKPSPSPLPALSRPRSSEVSAFDNPVNASTLVVVGEQGENYRLLQQTTEGGVET